MTPLVSTLNSERAIVHLQPLDCPSCGAALAADRNDVVAFCVACRNGYLLPDTNPAVGLVTATGPEPASETPPNAPVPGARAASLRPIAVRFVAMPHQTVDRYLPCWLLPARVTIHERRASGALVSGLLRAFVGADPEQGDGAAYFVVPAFAAPLSTVLSLTQRYSEALPELGELLGERLLGGSLSPADAEKLAHYALIAAEAGKSDLLEQLRYDLTFGPACLLGVPFIRRGSRLVDALFGVDSGLEVDPA